jgi:hypothetical protein
MSLGVGPVGRVYIFDVVPQAAVANNIATAATVTSAYTLTAGTSVKSVTLTNGSTGLQLDVPRAVSVTFGAGTIAGVPIWKAVFMAGIAGVAVVVEGLSRAFLDDGKLSLDEIDAVFSKVKKNEPESE